LATKVQGKSGSRWYDPAIRVIVS